MEKLLKIIGEIEKLESEKGMPNRQILMRNLKRNLISASNIKEKKVLEIGGKVLEWHPNFRTKNFPDGVLMIFSKKGYERTRSYRESKNGKD